MHLIDLCLYDCQQAYYHNKVKQAALVCKIAGVLEASGKPAGSKGHITLLSVFARHRRHNYSCCIVSLPPESSYTMFLVSVSCVPGVHDLDTSFWY